MSFEIEFEEPPAHLVEASGRGMPGKYLEFAIALREHPGRWAVLPGGEKRTEKGAKGTAQNIRRGQVKGFKKGEYDAITDGSKIWVKFLGAVQEDQATPKKSSETEDDEDASPAHGPAAAQIRAWALEQGMEVPERGRLPREIVDSYWAAHNGRPPSVVRVVR